MHGPMTFYARMYHAMLVWYQRWYSKEWQLQTITIVALSMSMFFNLLTIVHVLWIAGIRWGSYLALDDRRAELYLAAVLSCSIAANLLLGRRVAEQLRRVERGVQSRTAGTVAAPIYMIASFVAFIVSLIGALARST